MRPLKQLYLSAGLATFLLLGCTLGPDYQRPDLVLPDAWRMDYSSASELVNQKWWLKFNDPELNRLIDLALAENLDIKIAASRVEEYLGLLSTTRSQFFPEIGYNGGAERNRISKEAYGFIPGSDPYYSQYEAALGATWQLDLFGRVQRQNEAAIARVYETEQGRRGVIMSVITGVAASYINLRGLDRKLTIANETAESYKQSLDIFELRHKYGTVSMMEVAQIDSQYQQAIASIPQLEAQIAAQENLLAALIGKNPEGIVRGKELDEMQLPKVPSSLPSTLLTRRPDLMQAEQNLVAANAEVGVAETLYYPDISITGALGLASADLDDLLDGSAKTWNLGANITGPIFTFGRVEGQIQSAEARRNQAEASYRLAVINAFRDVNDALVSTSSNERTYEAQSKRTLALRLYAKYAAMRFESGVASYLDVLYANTELFDAELITVDAQVSHYTSLINIYKAMGGGWVDDAATATETVNVEEKMEQQPIL
ncbi:efflux transporter outer membrane subunit [Corallincola luteus]|uniref:Efflux transporter outer membrane subunit n=1 Tax=Corallincola luteus TaxID=1775177 RepID=A0ABY2ARK2_9GAMM|nr:efflux transporter outer membrane subunit [Corallincola luteus]TCI05258.1 efflux transporter outer membrane subunit [Corallincola luteus]